MLVIYIHSKLIDIVKNCIFFEPCIHLLGLFKLNNLTFAKESYPHRMYTSFCGHQALVFSGPFVRMEKYWIYQTVVTRSCLPTFPMMWVSLVYFQQKSIAQVYSTVDFHLGNERKLAKEFPVWPLCRQQQTA